MFGTIVARNSTMLLLMRTKMMIAMILMIVAVIIGSSYHPLDIPYGTGNHGRDGTANIPIHQNPTINSNAIKIDSSTESERITSNVAMVIPLPLLLELQHLSFAEGPEGQGRPRPGVGGRQSQQILSEFDGHGGLSAGGSTRLLRDYPEPYRSHILDYLFLPGFGATLGVLKLEIGGDTQSTVGTEASHWHSKDDRTDVNKSSSNTTSSDGSTDNDNNNNNKIKQRRNCHRGYEGWLAMEARRRNPHIKIWSLSWGVPGWVGGTGNNESNDTDGGYYSDDNINYQIAWLECLRDVYNVQSDYLCLWNERPQGTVEYVLKLRQQLDQRGFSNVGITLEATWQRLVDHVLDTNHPEFNRSVAAVTIHYPCNSQNTTQKHCQPAVQAHKKVWAGEDTPTPYGNWTAASCWGRKLSHHYLNFQMTSVISWAVIWSVWEGISDPVPRANDKTHHFGGTALMTASEPWSGHYTVPPTIWIHAHWGQFVPIGWRYLPKGNGSDFLWWSDANIDNDEPSGSYITLIPPPNFGGVNNSNDDGFMRTTTSTIQFTMIVETLHGLCDVVSTCKGSNVTGVQHLTFQVPQPTEGSNIVQSDKVDDAHLISRRKLMPKVLNVWCSNSTHVFVHKSPLPVHCSKSGGADNDHDCDHPSNEVCLFSIDMMPDSICTITTLSSETAGNKGTHIPPPPSTPFPTLYKDDFDDSNSQGNQLAWGFSDVYGSFEVQNQSLTQMATGRPIGWAPVNEDPLTLFGDVYWDGLDYVRVHALINHTDYHHYIRICGGCANVSNRRIRFECPLSCCFNLTWRGEWSVGPNYHGRIIQNYTNGVYDGVANHPFEDGWHAIQLEVTGEGRVIASVDKKMVVRTGPKTCIDRGMVGLGCGSYHKCAFRNFSVSAHR